MTTTTAGSIAEALLVRRCINTDDSTVCTTTTFPVPPAKPLGLLHGVALRGEEIIVSHDNGVATSDLTLATLTVNAIAAVGGLISAPVIAATSQSTSCTFVAIRSFHGDNGGGANRIHRLGLQDQASVATPSVAAGSITALTVGSDGNIWGAGASGVLFRVGLPANDCTLAVPTALGVARTLNSIAGVVSRGGEFVVGTEAGELQVLPRVAATTP